MNILCLKSRKAKVLAGIYRWFLCDKFGFYSFKSSFLAKIQWSLCYTCLLTLPPLFSLFLSLAMHPFVIVENIRSSKMNLLNIEIIIWSEIRWYVSIWFPHLSRPVSATKYHKEHVLSLKRPRLQKGKLLKCINFDYSFQDDRCSKVANFILYRFLTDNIDNIVNHVQ